MQTNDTPPRPTPSVASDAGSERDPRIGSILAERYRIDVLLGEGGMGKVYAGEHVLMRKRVAIKVLHKELTNLTDVVVRFEREAMAAANIDHPNVAGATDFGKLPDGSVFLVLEYVQGTSLRSEIADGCFGLVRALHVARQIASALAGAHARGIVHRDLKPENVMLVEKAGDPDFVKVLDFGIAKVPIQEIGERGSVRPGHVITKVGMIFGTPEYMAPEQALGQDVDGRADQYALGVILFEMLTGARPYKSDTAVGLLGQQLQGPPPSVAERAPHLLLPPGVEELVSRLLATERDLRFDSCNEVVEVIETMILALQPSVLIRGSRPDASSGPLTPPDGPPSSRNRSYDPILVDSRGEIRGLSVSSAAIAGRDGSLSGRLRWGLGSLFGGIKTLPIQLGLALLGGLFIGALFVVVGWFMTARPSKTVAASRPLSSVAGRIAEEHSAANEVVLPRAPEAELAMARGQGVAELERLAQKYPTDSGVVIEIAKAQLAASDCGACLGSVARALVSDPKVKNNAEVASLLWKSVQKRECLESAFKLLEGPMRDRGSDILYDLSTTEGVKRDVKTRADEYFASGRFRATASVALLTLIELRDAKDCAERLRLLERVLVDGDERVLPILKSMQLTTGCGEDKQADCNPCLRGSDKLARTIEVITLRSAH
ncbi:MAG: serine/threonine-protein kinase [Polyangiaceae bacterium]